MAPRQRLQAGITLIEILVVVFIIGVMAGAAVLSTSVTGSDQDLKQEALRVKSVLELLQEEALMQGRDYGLQITDTGYQFFVFDYDQYAWVETIDDEILRPYELDEKLSMELNLDGRDVILEPPEDGVEDPEPQIMLMSGGEITPFEMRFYRELTGGRFIVTGEITGKLEVTSRGFD